MNKCQAICSQNISHQPQKEIRADGFSQWLPHPISVRCSMKGHDHVAQIPEPVLTGSGDKNIL